MPEDIKTPHGHMISQLFEDVADKQRRRGVKRVPCSLPASIYFDGDVHLSDCVIKDISTTGMKILRPQVTWLPHTFWIKSPEFNGAVRVRQRWSGGSHVGLEIVGSGNVE